MFILHDAQVHTCIEVYVQGREGGREGGEEEGKRKGG